MSFMVYRMERDGSRAVVASADDWDEAWLEVSADREKHDSEAEYLVVNESETTGRQGPF